MWDDTHLLEMKVEATYGTKMTQFQVKTKVCHVWTQRLPTIVSFKGGSPPSIPNPSFFLTSPNLGMRFLLRVVVCHIPKLWNVKINKIGSMYVWMDLKFHKELKLLIHLRDLLEEPFQISKYSLKKLLWGKRNFKIPFCFLFKSYESNICNGKYFTKWFINLVIPKACLKIKIQISFYKVYSLI
jgi:hypothetical protein